MTACRSCGAALCDCPDLAFAGLAPAPIPTGTKADVAVHPATSGRIPAAGNSFNFRGAFGSHSTDGVGAAGQSRSGADNLEIPLHEDAE